MNVIEKYTDSKYAQELANKRSSLNASIGIVNRLVSETLLETIYDSLFNEHSENTFEVYFVPPKNVKTPGREFH
jgi:lysine/ornithine N-monooxygenase